MNYKSAPFVAVLMLRIALGVSMVMVGIAAYRDLAPFIANATDGLAWAGSFAYVWCFLLPALFIFGGGLLAIGRYQYLAAWTGGIALASIPMGIILKTIISGAPLPETLSASYPTFVWIIAFTLAICLVPEEVAEAEEE